MLLLTGASNESVLQELFTHMPLLLLPLLLLLLLPLLLLPLLPPLLVLLPPLRNCVTVVAGEGPPQRQHHDGCQWTPHTHRLWLHAEQHTRCACVCVGGGAGGRGEGQATAATAPCA